MHCYVVLIAASPLFAPRKEEEEEEKTNQKTHTPSPKPDTNRFNRSLLASKSPHRHSMLYGTFRCTSVSDHCSGEVYNMSNTRSMRSPLILASPNCSQTVQPFCQPRTFTKDKLMNYTNKPLLCLTLAEKTFASPNCSQPVQLFCQPSPPPHLHERQRKHY